MSNLQKIAKREMMNEYGKQLTKEATNKLDHDKMVNDIKLIFRCMMN